MAKRIQLNEKEKQKGNPNSGNSKLSVTFLGGLNKIGRNCMVLEYNERLLVIDCGIMFPEVDMLGIDFILPDLNYLYERKDQIDGIVITHAHEDHAGGLQFLLREVQAPIYSSQLSLALLSKRLDEGGVLSKTSLVEVHDGETHKIGEFDVEFLPVTHSVPHAFAASYSCDGGTIFHTGDFKIDHSPIDGRRTDLARIGEIASSKEILLLLSDSTGAERPGTTRSESTVRTSIERIFRENQNKRIIVSTFASHIHRMIQIIEAALEQDRKLAFLGRSMKTNIAIARELGILTFDDRCLIDIEEVEHYGAEEVCVICTGSQGEPLSALSLISSGQSKFLSVNEDDVVVLSSHTIPGNETGVNRIINGLMRRGAKVIHDDNAPIHVSGHASADELLTMLAITKPKYFVPVHGEHRHMKAHAELALDAGMPKENVFICHDGDAIVFDGDSAQIENDRASSAYLYVDGNVGGITNALLRDRREIGSDGLIVIVVTVDYQDGSIVGDVEVVTRGWIPRADVDDYKSVTQERVRSAVENALQAGEREIEALKAIVRKAAGASTTDTTGRRPIVLPLVIEV
ncbi:MAG TPA: ribonuclease J [Acidimicrobiia bacterium]|nr:ribonuclease J [Acidimicrobiia bacterium]